MKKLILRLATLGIASGLFAGAAMAQTTTDPWLVRVRAVNIDPVNGSSPLGGVGAADRVHVLNKTIPEVDFSYAFAPNWAAELILTYPQKHDVTLDGAKIGTLKHLPPTLTVQYHFAPEATINPYLGAGVNYTRISNVKLLNGAGGLEKSSFGYALQAGLDFKLDKNWTFNLDIKKVQIRADLSVSGAKVSTLKLDPVLFGAGFGYRF
jgi:outer membrane protein